MELRHLRYFVAVAEDLHFGRAADRLNMTQQPLSRQIRDLEKELGIELFYRTKRTIRLTEIGQLFLIEARKTLTQADLAVMTVQRASRGEIGHLTVGFTGSALNSMLPDIVGCFRNSYPQVELSLKELRTNEQVEALHNGKIQVGLLHPPIADETLIWETIHTENLLAVLPDTHPLAEISNAISIKQLAEEDFILFPRSIGPVLYDRIIATCQKAGFSPRIIQEVMPQQTILGLVSVGIGIGLLHASVKVLSRKGVIYKPLIEPTPQLELAVAWYRDSNNPILPSFVKIVREIAFNKPA